MQQKITSKNASHNSKGFQNSQNSDGIVLLAKQPGLTSFSSLNSVKKALNTKKVGHTGTLDSFAQGLLIVCTGRLTRLAGRITEFNKTYQAVIKFGEETDTYEYTGKITKKTVLPEKSDFEKAVNKFTGEIMQNPPFFSAIHINGERASSLARNGQKVEIPARKVTVFNSKILDTVCNNKNQVEYALVEFTVSKGTYIRSLAFDIGRECKSSAHLAGLYRTKVGNFFVEDAAGFENIEKFCIQTAIKTMNEQKDIIKKQEEQKLLKEKQTENQKSGKKQKQSFILTPQEIQLQKEILQKKIQFTPEIAKLCGLIPIYLVNEDAENAFFNGKPLQKSYFSLSLNTHQSIEKKLPENCEISVFSTKNQFSGIISKTYSKFKYCFVINTP